MVDNFRDLEDSSGKSNQRLRRSNVCDDEEREPRFLENVDTICAGIVYKVKRRSEFYTGVEALRLYEFIDNDVYFSDNKGVKRKWEDNVMWRDRASC